MRNHFSEHEGYFLERRSVLKLDCGACNTATLILLKGLWLLHLINFTVCESYPNRVAYSCISIKDFKYA